MNIEGLKKICEEGSPGEYEANVTPSVVLALIRELEEARKDAVKIVQDLIDSHKRDTNGECDESCDIVAGMEAAREALVAREKQG